MKGYNKLSDVRYGLSENELLLEIRQGSIFHRFCKTLFKEIEVDQSSVELLVDFVSVKLRKRDKDAVWDQGVGYDISEFSIPNIG